MGASAINRAPATTAARWVGETDESGRRRRLGMDPGSLDEKISGGRIVSFRNQAQRLFSAQYPPEIPCAGKADVKAPMWKTAADRVAA